MAVPALPCTSEPKRVPAVWVVRSVAVVTGIRAPPRLLMFMAPPETESGLDTRSASLLIIGQKGKRVAILFSPGISGVWEEERHGIGSRPMAAPAPMTQCRTHPASRAGWTCDACGASLCPECVAEERFGSTVVESCSHCGGRALELKVHRSQRPYVSRLGGSVRFMTRPSTLFSLGALAIFCAVMSWLGGLLGFLLQLGATWGWYFHIFLTAARGGELDAPDFTDRSDFTGPLFRALASSFFVWGPAVLYAVFFGPEDDGADSRSLFVDPVFWLILGWGLFFAPITFMVAATNSSMLHLFNPVALVGWAFKLGKDYLIALGVVGAAMIVGVGLGMLGGAVRGAGVPFVSRLIPEALGLLMPFFSAHALGVLLHVHGDKIGYGLESDYYEPALPGARPRGRLPSKVREPSAPAVGTVWGGAWRRCSRLARERWRSRRRCRSTTGAEPCGRWRTPSRRGMRRARCRPTRGWLRRPTRAWRRSSMSSWGVRP